MQAVGQGLLNLRGVQSDLGGTQAYHKEKNKKKGQEKDPEHEDDLEEIIKSILARILKVEMEAKIRQLTKTLKKKDMQLLEEANSAQTMLAKGIQTE